MQKTETIQGEELDRAWPDSDEDYGVGSIRESIIHHLLSFQGRDPERSGPNDISKALAYTLRDILVKKWIIMMQYPEQIHSI